jgi:hypothetical protein
LEKQRILAYFGHHKCASTLMLTIIGKVCRHLGLKHSHYHSPKMWGYESGFTLDKMADENKLDFVSYIAADLKFIGDPNRFRGLHIIRDPRDIAISAYFSHLHSHSTYGWPELAEFRQSLEKLPKDEGILRNFSFTAKLPTDGWNTNLFDTLSEWNYHAENIMEVRFEDLVRGPYQCLLEMFDFLGLIEYSEPRVADFLRYCFSSAEPWWIFKRKRPSSIPAWVLLMIVYENRFLKLAGGRKTGQEDEKSHYRKGTPGDWKNHFNDQHKQYFKEHYGELLIKLGYEKGYEW